METKRINVTFDIETYKQIKAIAHRENLAMSEVVRSWSQAALNGQVNRDNIDLITKIIREELKVIINPSIERIASLSAKTCVQASASAYLGAEVIASFVPENRQQDFRETYEAARKKGVMYTKGKTDFNLDL